MLIIQNPLLRIGFFVHTSLYESKLSTAQHKQKNPALCAGF
jgi:hypothetical protein